MYLNMEMKFARGSSMFARTNDIARFCVYFLISIAVSIAMYMCMRNSSIIEPLLDLNARLTSSVWNLFGNSIYVNGAFIYCSNFKFNVTAECTSIAPTFIFISAVIAWPSTIKEKLYGILIGSAALFIINLVRMLTLFYIGSYFPDYIDLFHYYIWQGLIVILALGLWIFWIDKIVHNTAVQSTKTMGDNT